MEGYGGFIKRPAISGIKREKKERKTYRKSTVVQMQELNQNGPSRGGEPSWLAEEAGGRRGKDFVKKKSAQRSHQLPAP